MGELMDDPYCSTEALRSTLEQFLRERHNGWHFAVFAHQPTQSVCVAGVGPEFQLVLYVKPPTSRDLFAEWADDVTRAVEEIMHVRGRVRQSRTVFVNVLEHVRR